jgi:hypothetical protein
MNKQVPLKEIVTVTEMSRMCGLSRARFYQLIHESVFPTPSRNKQTGRPFFDRAQQEQCLLIRRINKGANGRAVMFYGCRLETRPLPPKRKRLPISKSSKSPPRQDLVVRDLRHGLTQLGVASVTEQRVRQALVEAYPDGHRDVESADLLRTVFGVIQCRDSTDKLSG